MDTVNDVPAGQMGEVSVPLVMAIMGAILNYIVEFSLNDQRRDKIQAQLDTYDGFDFIVGNRFSHTSLLNFVYNILAASNSSGVL